MAGKSANMTRALMKPVEQFKKLSLRLTRAEWKKLKSEAMDQDTTMQQLALQALRDYLKEIAAKA